MDEITYLDAPGATVTSSRIVIGSHTFATRNVGSVAVNEVAKPSWPYLIGLIGLVMAFGPGASGFGTRNIIGLALVIGSVVKLFAPRKLHLKLNAGGGEIMALETTNRATIDALHGAIVQAIAAR